MKPDNRLWLLMSRRLSREASPDEVRELQDLLEESPDKQQLLDILHSYFSALSSQSKPETADPDIEQRFRRVIQSAAETDPVVITGPPPARKGRLRKIGARKMGARTWMYYAAALAGMLVVSWSIFHQRLLPAM